MEIVQNPGNLDKAQILEWVAVGSHSLLQGIFLTQGLNPCLLHCRWILYHLSHLGSLRILEWVAGELPYLGIELGSPA